MNSQRQNHSKETSVPVESPEIDSKETGSSARLRGPTFQATSEILDGVGSRDSLSLLSRMLGIPISLVALVLKWRSILRRDKDRDSDRTIDAMFIVMPFVGIAFILYLPWSLHREAWRDE